MIHIHNILVPTDFSPSSAFAVDMACAIAREQGAHVILMHAAPQPPSLIRDVPAFKEQHVHEDVMAYRQEIVSRINHLRDEVPLGNVESLVVEGDASEAILRVAEGKSCDLIIMGTYGKSGMLQATMGSVAAEVSRKARCPVLTVRVPSSTPAISPKEAATACAVR